MIKSISQILSTLLIIIFLSGCCACDCPGYADFDIYFYDMATGEEFEITPSCDGVGRTVEIELIDEPINSYSYQYCGNYIYMRNNHNSSNLCSDNLLKFNILHDGQIVESVTAKFRQNANSCCDCNDVCMYFEEVIQDSLGVTLVDIGKLRVEI